MAILANQKILTLDYWKLAQDIKKGDIVFDKQGEPRQVTLVQIYRSDNCYSVLFNDLLEVAGDENLGFLVETAKYRKQLYRYKGVLKFRQKLNFKKIKDLLNTNERLSIPTTDPINLPHQNLPVPPFIFGFWFFNLKPKNYLAAPRGLAKPIYEKFKDHGYLIKEGKKHRNGENRFITTPSIETHLAGYEKHRIPNNYLLASKEQRLELLQGILYAKPKQYSRTTDTFRFTSKYRVIALQVQGLLESLGHRIKVYYDEYRNHYKITFRSKLRLMENQLELKKPLVHNGRRFIENIKTLPAQLCVHIETNGPDNSYLVGEGFIACL